MNTKVLASLGVIVAFLTAWLFFSLYAAANVVVEDSAPSAASESRVPFAQAEAFGLGESQGVHTSVTVANQDVMTSVQVAE